MEKIQTLEQLDKVGLKICELLNVGIDKASVIIPETFQQYIQYTIAINSLWLCVIVVIALCVIAAGIYFRCKLDKDDLMYGEAVTLTYALPIACVVILIIPTSIVIEPLLKAIFAPNILIIEKFSYLLK